jgi:non-canonical (house-cleaning) NTP pyrophosphatase
VFVFAVAGINQSSSKEYNTPIRNAASYIKEVVQLMADPSTINMPFLNGTEKLVPAWPIPNIPPFPSHQYPTSGNEILLVIPTENKQKILLLQEFVIDRAPEGVAVQSVTVPVESGVGEQPYNEAGLKGAYNRINNALNRLHSEEFKNLFINKHIGTVIVASIESFIQTENIDRPSDFGVIVIHNATTQKTESCLSEGVTVSPKYVSRAQRFGCDGDPNYGKVTVGQIMAARVPTLDKANWQAVLANCSRYELLKNAIKEIPVPW